MISLPIFQALINDEMDGITAISLVDEGAVEVDFQMFDKQKSLQQFAIQNEEEHLLLGCVMRCDFDIYRNDGGFEYFIRYDKKTIEKMATKMMADGTFANIRMQHQGQNLPKGAIELRELFIKDSTKGISPNGFEDVNDGSLFAVYKVNSPELWDMCKAGIFNSFSLEGYFKTVEVKANKQEEQNKSIMSKIKEFIKNALQEFASAKAEDGTELFYDGEEIAVGVEVADEQGNPIADGEYTVEDKVIVVKDGVVAEINEEQPAEDEPTEEPTEETEPVEEPEKSDEPVDEPTEETEPEPEPEPEPENPANNVEGEIAKLNAEIDALKSVIEALKSEIEGIKEQLTEPAAEPIVEEFSRVTENKSKTGNKKLDRMIEIASSLG